MCPGVSSGVESRDGGSGTWDGVSGRLGPGDGPNPDRGPGVSAGGRPDPGCCGVAELPGPHVTFLTRSKKSWIVSAEALVVLFKFLVGEIQVEEIIRIIGGRCHYIFQNTAYL